MLEKHLGADSKESHGKELERVSLPLALSGSLPLPGPGDNPISFEGPRRKPNSYHAKFIQNESLLRLAYRIYTI